MAKTSNNGSTKGGKNAELQRTDSADVVVGTRFADQIEAGKGDDTITGGEGGDLYVFRSGDGNDTITDFGSGDRFLFDIGGSYSDQIAFGTIHDGDVFTTFTGGATFSFDAIDANGDGVTDTLITAADNNDPTQSVTVTLLGVDPDSLLWSQFAGG